jgi:hypothetical protein
MGGVVTELQVAGAHGGARGGDAARKDLGVVADELAPDGEVDAATVGELHVVGAATERRDVGYGGEQRPAGRDALRDELEVTAPSPDHHELAAVRGDRAFLVVVGEVRDDGHEGTHRGRGCVEHHRAQLTARRDESVVQHEEPAGGRGHADEDRARDRGDEGDRRIEHRAVCRDA